MPFKFALKTFEDNKRPTDAKSEEPAKKPRVTVALSGGTMVQRGFKLPAPATPRPPAKAPKAKDMVIGTFKPLPPPDAVRAKLCIDNPLIMAIDVETHACTRQKILEWRVGRFELLTKLGEKDAEFLRIVQIGWTIGRRGTPDVQPQVHLIKPDGFVIEAQATKKKQTKGSYSERTRPRTRVSLKSY